MAAINLGEVHTKVLQFLLGTRCFDNAGLAIGTTTTTVKTANAIDYCINGMVYSKAATDDFFVHTDLTVQADGTTKYYLLTIDASGNDHVIQGTATALPDVPSAQCPVGALKIVTSGAAFTPATTAHGAAGVTTTYYNLSCVPVSGLPS
jgi:hypothetical protein